MQTHQGVNKSTGANVFCLDNKWWESFRRRRPVDTYCAPFSFVFLHTYQRVFFCDSLSLWPKEIINKQEKKPSIHVHVGGQNHGFNVMKKNGFHTQTDTIQEGRYNSECILAVRRIRSKVRSMGWVGTSGWGSWVLYVTEVFVANAQRLQEVLVRLGAESFYFVTLQE